MQTKTFVASAIISELQSSDIYLTVKARLFDLNANLNSVRVTERFLDQIVNNEEKYIGIPLCADVRGLLANRTIGHMYNKHTGEFHSTAIGSFYHFQKQIDGQNTYMIGYARIMKRNKAVCAAISRLFAQNSLKFSFEISCGEYEQQEDGTMVIDVSDKNFLEGAAVVTFPACEQAVALQLVAECLKGDENMIDVIIQNNETEIVAEAENKDIEINASTKVISEEQTAQSVEPAVNSTAQQQQNTDDASCPMEDEEKKEQTAEQNAECKKNAEQTDASCKKNAEQTDTSCKKNAEEQSAECKKTSQEQTAACGEPKEEDAACKKQAEQVATCGQPKEQNASEQDAACKKNAEAVDVNTLIVELASRINQLSEEVCLLRAFLFEQFKPAECPPPVAEVTVAEAEVSNEQQIIQVAEQKEDQYKYTLVNPFMAEIATPKKYSLLDKSENTTGYSLLERY